MMKSKFDIDLNHPADQATLGFSTCSYRFKIQENPSKEEKMRLLIERKKALVLYKAMKSSPLLGPFCGSEFWGFSLLKI